MGDILFHDNPYFCFDMHDHDHSHHHHHASPADLASGVFITGIVLNSVYVITEAVVGLYSHSMALLSDAGHNLSDVAALILSLFAFKLAKVRPTHTYTYGFKKTTILAALINAVVLLIAIGTLGYGSVSRLYHPVPVEGGVIAWVATLGIVINGISAFLFFRKKDHDLNTKGAYLHLLSDALVSAIVVITGIIISYTHLYWLDPLISIVVLLFILFSTWSLLSASFKLTIDAVPQGLDVEKIKQLIKNMPGVEDLHHTHIWAMSTTENALTAHVVMNSVLSFDEKLQLIQKIKHELLHHDIHHATIELEAQGKPCPDEEC